MTSSKISNLAAGFSVNSTTVGNTDSAKKTGNNQSVFASLMGQGSKPNVSGQVSGAVSQSKNQQTSETVKQDTVKSQDTSKIKRASDSTSAIKEKITENEDTVTDEIKDVIKNELSVTDEQLEEAMSELGLTAMDLINPADLTQVVAKLTGSQDVSELLMSDGFVNIMQQIGDIATNLADNLGVSLQELQTLVDQMNQSQGSDMEMPVELTTDQMDNTTAQVQETVSDLATESQSEKAVKNLVVNNQKTAGVQNMSEAADDVSSTVLTQATEESEARQGILTAQTDMSGETETGDLTKQDSQGQSFFQKNSQHSTDVNYAEILSHDMNRNISPVDNLAVQTPNVPTYTTTVDVADILNQIAEFTKINVSQDTTSIEMQLNPENLGKVYLQISSTKEGNVTAQFAAQNETVRQALETQVADLRQTLNQQGIKVDAIEVTVASHEFERNLEQNASDGQQQSSDGQQQRSARRNIQIDNLDELSGLMTDEELLTARIMKENGNSMDVTA